MMWGVAAAAASAAAVAVASGAELLACDCAPSVPAATVVVGRCDGLLFRKQVRAARITISSIALTLDPLLPRNLLPEQFNSVLIWDHGGVVTVLFFSLLSQKSSPSTGENRGEEKFAPRCDGLRFIETLVTAHR
jgi:hypothetical protein